MWLFGLISTSGAAACNEPTGGARLGYTHRVVGLRVGPMDASGVDLMITLTDTAEQELRRLVAGQESPDIALRVFVSPGGCSGMSYGMAFDDEEQEGDQVFDHDGVRVRVDEMSAMYLEGSEIDFVDQLMGGGFAIHNPNAVRSCACGHSFDTGSDNATARTCS